MSLVIRRDKDGNFIRPSKEDIQREKSRMDRLKRRAADYKRKRREEKRLDRKNVRTPPGKPGVGIGRKVTKTTGKRLSAKDKAAALKLREVALKKAREGQVKKEKATERPRGSRTGLTVTPRRPKPPGTPRITKTLNRTGRRKNPAVKAPGSGTKVRRPAPDFKSRGILNRKNPVTRNFMNRLVRGKNSRGQRSQTKKRAGF
tara:strand:- start:59 stop:664 length:606 start_codon:yes stop_codon:yes gene_type:complete